ncbi:alpha/beta fold hydrolase [Kutzneria kofuensis]|uniref:Pimeloyl-ACP methyl ester carboxylesterase n=1 Tax=Kutzneria kofuensis TaxID=103725 RepID=A0A7W9NE81_9PSEU|nr:alpha/beta hydrolase [Kutzneria kofuensis]MBB5890047.1 pimeloyl-ACP methyl ester carboxylesterase [Kutzneria kofuensis]
MEWDIRVHGPRDTAHSVLLLSGGLSTAEFYAEVAARPELAGLKLVAATLPGHGGSPPPEDPGIEACAHDAAKLAAEHGCDVVVGYSMGANVALEMAAAEGFTGPIILLGPSFSVPDEMLTLRVLDRLSIVFGQLPYAFMLEFTDVALSAAQLPPERRNVLGNEVRKNNPRHIRRLIRAYLDYLRQHGSVAPRLCETTVPAWVVHAERGDGGLTAAERRTLTACPTTTVVTVPGTSWFLPNEKPELVADLILGALP